MGYGRMRRVFLAMAAGKIAENTSSGIVVWGGVWWGMPEIGYGVQLGQTGRFLTTLALKHAPIITTGSHTLRHRAGQFVSADKITTLPLAIDPSLFHPIHHSPIAKRPPFTLLHVASLVPIKNQALLLRAFARVAPDFPQVQLKVIGDGPLRQKLTQLSQQLGIAQRVTFVGSVPMTNCHNTIRQLIFFCSLPIMRVKQW